MVVLRDLPDEWLSMVFRSLGVRWLAAEGCICHDSTLLTPPQLLLVASALSQRFDAMNSIGDEAVALISARCPNLVRLKLGACRQISYRGILSCVDCNFGTKGISAMLAHCPLLEEISVMLLEDCTDDIVVSPWSAPSLKVIPLIWFHVECIFPLVAGFPNLHILRLSNVLGIGIACWRSFPNESEVWSFTWREGEAWSISHIGGYWLSATAHRCLNLQELVLSGVKPTERAWGSSQAAPDEGVDRLKAIRECAAVYLKKSPVHVKRVRTIDDDNDQLRCLDEEIYDRSGGRGSLVWVSSSDEFQVFSHLKVGRKGEAGNVSHSKELH
ncbi:unnamed protein product [Spirodela intermedia]|uniref:Uncharacterized protein n=1 Tax=Spirodela intermedia TaxID=51605 RepID=A0A7I8ITT0_SPIIN|nr:unnamed protein product [Spirodela intermedia]CAA6661396.1 unnamed protein product [Spirodela intermedia]